MKHRSGRRLRFRRALCATALLVSLPLASIPAARGDIGFESASRSKAAPGEGVRVTVACGFCFPRCVGRPGHRYPPGDRHGVCMLGSRSGPPARFPIWLTPRGHSLEPYRCGGEDQCAPGSSRPPHLPSFTYLGRAERAFRPGGLGRGEFPRYVLGFQVPSLPSGAYQYVLYCASCVAGPRGSLIDAGAAAAGQLWILPAEQSAGGGRAWIAGGIAAAILLPGLGLLLHRRRRRTR
jgi:hypothetical protein